MPEAFDTVVAHHPVDAEVASALCGMLTRAGVGVLPMSPSAGSDASGLDTLRDAKTFLVLSSPSAGTSYLESDWFDQRLHAAAEAGLDLVRVQVGVSASKPAGAPHRLLRDCPAFFTPDSVITQGSADAIISMIRTEPLDLERELHGLLVEPDELRQLIAGVIALVPSEALPGPVETIPRSMTGKELLGLAHQVEEPWLKAIFGRALAIGLVRRIARREQAQSMPSDIRPLWRLLRPALGPGSGLPLRITKSSQGFHVAPLFFAERNGSLGELIRLHYWPPDADGPPNDLAVHSHQAFARSWVMAGEIANRTYDVEVVEAATDAALFSVRWDDQTDYDVLHRVSTLRNTGRHVSVKHSGTAVFRPGRTYSVGECDFHETANGLGSRLATATLFYFDSGQGWCEDAAVVGPASLSHPPAHSRDAGNEQDFVTGVDSLMGG